MSKVNLSRVHFFGWREERPKQSKNQSGRMKRENRLRCLLYLLRSTSGRFCQNQPLYRQWHVASPMHLEH